MRIRKAAIAGATAIAVAFGGTTIASAEEGDTSSLSSESGTADSAPTLSSKIADSPVVDRGEGNDKNTQFTGQDIFSSSKNFDNVPDWAQGFYALTVLASIGSIIGLIVGPLANYIKFIQYTAASNKITSKGSILMRKFRTAAVTAVTTVELSFTGLTAASAEEPDHQNSNSSFVEGSSVLSSDRAQEVLSSDNSEQFPTLSSKFGELMNAGEDVSGTEFLGSAKGNQEDNGDVTNPGWARIWRDGTVVAAIGTALGGVIAAYNYGVYNGYFPHFIQF